MLYVRKLSYYRGIFIKFQVFSGLPLNFQDISELPLNFLNISGIGSRGVGDFILQPGIL